jgi:class 3 adenylate cyclase
MVKKCVLFTDIKSSSKLWGLYPKQMPKVLAQHEQVIRRVIHKYKGLLLKTIGDAVMAEFNTLHDGVCAAIDIQTIFRNKPLVLSTVDKLQIRIGVAFGEIHIKNILVQKYKLRDVFGATVNLASRMESKVSQVGGFGILDRNMNKQTLDLLKQRCDLKRVHFVHKCDKKIYRSKRLLTECQPIETLHIHDDNEYTALSCVLK